MHQEDAYTPVSGIYKITNKKNGKIYVGSSLNIYKRWWYHAERLNNNTHTNPHLQASWNKYGGNNFCFSIIEIVNADNLLEREQYWIDVLQPQYNMKMALI
jgi:group I intron endonuclease